MGREVRRVPATWEHPRDDKGSYIPLYGYSFSARLREWDEGKTKWNQGLRDDYAGGWQPLGDVASESYEEWSGQRPVESDYMPDWPEAERTHYQMYEDTTEGTPISPVMSSPEELAHWLANNNASANGGMTASYQAWLRVCNGGYAPSMVMAGGVIQSGVEALRNKD
jgi:hypothetical protein